MKKPINLLNMNQEEINEIPDDEFRNINPFLKRGCDSCSSLSSVLSWWCSNEEAIEARGTRIPGCIKCPYWSPNKVFINSIKDKNLSSVICPDGKRYNL